VLAIFAGLGCGLSITATVCAAPDGLDVDGLLVADDALATSAVTGAVAVVPLRRATDLLLRLGGDELLRRQVAAVLVLEGEGWGLQGGRSSCCCLQCCRQGLCPATRASQPTVQRRATFPRSAQIVRRMDE